MTTIRATGHITDPPTLTVSGGRGNTDLPEIHLMFRDSDGESTRTLIGWFNRDELLDAIFDADAVTRKRLLEPAL